MNEAPLFDPSVFRGLCSELGNEDAAEVLQAFLADTPGKIAIMTSAMADRPSIKRIRSKARRRSSALQNCRRWRATSNQASRA
jgi:hypothetical protein